MSESLAAAFGPGAIRLDQPARSWREAIALAGQALEVSNRCDGDYGLAMIEAVEEFGPYIVITPGVALAHARPSRLVFETGLSLVGLREPVTFGHELHDPVSLVFGLCALDHDRHLELLAELAEFLIEPSNLVSLQESAEEEVIRALFGSWRSN